MYNQVRGGGSRVVMYPESALRVLSGAQGVVLPVLSEGFSAKPGKETKGTIRGLRGPGKPFRGAWTLSGALTIPANVFALGHLLTAMCGPGVKTAVPALALDGPAVNRGAGTVGLPCPGHGLEPDTVVSVAGSEHYDGQYLLLPGTAADTLVVRAAYVAEAFAGGTALVHRGRVARLGAGPAVDRGAGTVGLPCPGHGFAPGERVEVTGSDSYAGQYNVLAASTSDELVVSATYEAETFDGQELVIPRFFRREFALPDTQPSRMMEVYFDHDPGAAQTPYDQYQGCKVSGLKVTVGGDGQLTLDLSFQPSAFASAADPVDPAPEELAERDFGMFEAFVYESGQRMGELEEGSLDVDLAIEGKYGVGDRGNISRLNEGDPTLGGSLNCFLLDERLLAKARADEPTSLTLALLGARGDEVRVSYPEAELNTEGRVVTGKGGLNVTFEVMGYVQAAPSCLRMTHVSQMHTILGEE